MAKRARSKTGGGCKKKLAVKLTMEQLAVKNAARVRRRAHKVAVAVAKKARHLARRAAAGKPSVRSRRRVEAARSQRLAVT